MLLEYRCLDLGLVDTDVNIGDGTLVHVDAKRMIQTDDEKVIARLDQLPEVFQRVPEFERKAVVTPKEPMKKAVKAPKEEGI